MDVIIVIARSNWQAEWIRRFDNIQNKIISVTFIVKYYHIIDFKVIVNVDDLCVN